jgi:hypothetical protein
MKWKDKEVLHLPLYDNDSDRFPAYQGNENCVIRVVESMSRSGAAYFREENDSVLVHSSSTKCNQRRRNANTRNFNNG